MIFRFVQKWSLPSLVILLTFSLSSAQSEGIRFLEGSWKDIVQKAQKENKPIFVDAYTTWCGPCKWLSKNVFTDASVGDFFNKNYIPYKMDMEKGEGPEFAQKHNVSAYPTLLYFSPEGELVHKTIGALPTKALVQAAMDALDPKKQIYTLEKKYEAGERSPEFLYRYANGLALANEDATAASDEYLKTQKDWATQKNFELITKVFADYQSPIFKRVLDDQKRYEKILGRDVLNQYVIRSFGLGIREVAHSGSNSDKVKLEADIKEYAPEQANQIISKFNYYFHTITESGKSYKYAKRYFSKYCDDWSELNTIAWEYYEREDSKSKLKAAIKWIQRSVAMDRNFYNMDTYAALLHKVGKNKEAKPIAEEAVQLGKANGMDTKSTEELLEAIKKKD